MNLDSWRAVASAIVAARAGRCRFTEMPAMVAALAICSGVTWNVVPDAVASQAAGLERRGHRLAGHDGGEDRAHDGQREQRVQRRTSRCESLTDAPSSRAGRR